MRAAREHIKAENDTEALTAYKLSSSYFEFNWHYHPEYELTLILNTSGKRMAGDSYENFKPGDLVLLGSNLPHTWASEKQKGNKKHEAIVIQFSEKLFESFADINAFKSIKRMLSNSTTGLAFKRNDALQKMLELLPHKKGMERISALLMVLEKLSHEKYRKLASIKYEPPKGRENERRINKVFALIQKKFAEQITIHDAAAIIHLSPSAFCKFFKRVAQKTFSDYVNEIRIAHACSLLIETDKPVSLVANECGYENLAYFNRVFLKKKKMTPGKYRKV